MPVVELWARYRAHYTLIAWCPGNMKTYFRKKNHIWFFWGNKSSYPRGNLTFLGWLNLHISKKRNVSLHRTNDYTKYVHFKFVDFYFESNNVALFRLIKIRPWRLGGYDCDIDWKSKINLCTFCLPIFLKFALFTINA